MNREADIKDAVQHIAMCIGQEVTEEKYHLALKYLDEIEEIALSALWNKFDPEDGKIPEQENQYYECWCEIDPERNNGYFVLCNWIGGRFVGSPRIVRGEVMGYNDETDNVTAFRGPLTPPNGEKDG